MSMLSFSVSENRYAIDHDHILRVIPKVLLKQIPDMPFYIAGFLNLRGEQIPVVDFCRLIEQRDTQNYLHSRIILVKDPNLESHLVIGILGEKVSEIIECLPENFDKIEFNFSHFPYLEMIYNEEQGMIQLLNVENFIRFLSAEIFKGTRSKNGL